MNLLIAIVVYLALFVAVTGVGRASWEVYRNLKKGKRLSDEWGAITSQYLGLLLLALYPLTTGVLPEDWHTMLAFMGLGMLGFGSFLRWRLVLPKAKAKNASPKSTAPERVANR